MDSFVDPHLTWRPLGDQDWEEVARLQTQIAVIDDPLLSTTSELLDSLAPDADRGEAVGGWDDYGSLSAFAWNFIDPEEEGPLVHLLGAVHPTHRHQGIGANLLRWQVEHAIAWRDATHPGQELRLRCVVEGQPGLEQLLLHRGFTLTRCLIDMTRPLHPLPVPVSPAGVEFVPFASELSDPVLDLHRVCFEAPFPRQTWEESLASESFRAHWSVVALRNGEVIGYCLNARVPGIDGDAEQGWCDRLGVTPSERRHGVAEAMLARSMRVMAADGIESCGISVDVPNRTIAAWLTRTLGYEEADSVVTLERTID
ncbi:MAG: GNAT family N-acetyltransferase [Arachnia propionica]|uniref:GNAT family N-acetyltransferase n=1 Tax=Arachnia propionica TaxID=1750 RepID=UPI0026FA0EB2|nr:GNAT family N-acetyltransferase [Arachnia propionica]